MSLPEIWMLVCRQGYQFQMDTYKLLFGIKCLHRFLNVKVLKNCKNFYESSLTSLCIIVLCIIHISTLDELSAVDDLDTLGGVARHGAALLHPPHHLHARHHLAEHHVLPVQPLQ